MISENCSIDEFVETVKGKTPWEVIPIAIDEVTQADRALRHVDRQDGCHASCSRQYSRDLKRLINYMRFTIKPSCLNDQVYHLYTIYWGNA